MKTISRAMKTTEMCFSINLDVLNFALAPNKAAHLGDKCIRETSLNYADVSMPTFVRNLKEKVNIFFVVIKCALKVCRCQCCHFCVVVNMFNAPEGNMPNLP